VRTWGDDGLHDVRLDIDFEKGETRTHGTNRARRYLWKNGVVFREETFGGEWAIERLRDEDELLISVKNGAGEERTYEHDARGNLIQETDPAGNVSTWEIHDDLPARHLGPTGLPTRYVHDHLGSLLEVAYPTGLSYRFELDREGRVVAILGADGVRARLDYDEHNNLRTDTSSRGATTTYRHDALARPVERTDALGRRMRIRYDLMGRVLERLRPDGTSVLAAYDRQGNLASTTDALGQTTRMEHAGTGHLARLIQADGQVFRFTYDSDERLVQILNPRLEKYEFEYDRADQIVAERTFDNQLLTYRYSRSNRLTRIDYPEGEWRELSHDKLGNVLEDRSSDVQVAFTRDALGRVEKAVSKDVTGQVVTELERDSFGRLTADIQNGRAVRYEYDGRGRRCARVLPDGERTDYHFDHDDAFLGVTHEGRTVTLERDKLGRERGRSAAGWKLEREYDAMDRLLSQKVVTPEPGAGVPRILAQRRYAYDAKGRVTSIDSPHGGLTLYRYDSVDQLIEASRGSVQEVFEYDPAGSLTSVLGDLADLGKKAAWSLAAGNRLKSTDRAQYINDGRGRRIQRVERTDGKDPRENPPRGDELITTYGWDSYDRLREVVLPGGARARYIYDAFGRRVRKDVLPPPVDLTLLLTAPPAGVKAQSRRTVHFLWDGEVLCEERDSAREEAAQKRVHVHEPDTFTPMLQAEQGDVFGVVVDHLGTPRELVDSAGRIAWRAAHSAWGKVVEVARDDGAASVESPFRFQGQYADAETGLCATRFRYFEADTGRWLSPDPLGFLGGHNLLGFGGCPTLVTDPLGLVCASDFATNPNEAFFWSGRTPNGTGGHKGGQDDAAVIAAAHGGTTLEMLIAQRGIVLPPWDANNPAVVTAWKDASRSYAEGVSGTVYAVIGSSLRPGNVWETAELPALHTNPNVTKLVQIDPLTGVQTTIFER
jgi:RHS repeat-associated protein